MNRKVSTISAVVFIILALFNVREGGFLTVAAIGTIVTASAFLVVLWRSPNA